MGGSPIDHCYFTCICTCKAIDRVLSMSCIDAQGVHVVVLYLALLSAGHLANQTRASNQRLCRQQ